MDMDSKGVYVYVSDASKEPSEKYRAEDLTGAEALDSIASKHMVREWLPIDENGHSSLWTDDEIGVIVLLSDKPFPQG